MKSPSVPRTFTVYLTDGSIISMELQLGRAVLIGSMPEAGFAAEQSFPPRLGTIIKLAEALAFLLDDAPEADNGGN